MGIGIDKWQPDFKKTWRQGWASGEFSWEESLAVKGLPHSSPPLSGLAGQVVAVVWVVLLWVSLFLTFLCFLNYIHLIYFLLLFRFSFSFILMAFCVKAFVYFTDPVFSKIISILFYVYSFLILIWNILLCVLPFVTAFGFPISHILK